MFPLAFVFLAVAVVLAWRARQTRRVALALAVFLAIGAPQIVALSNAKGRITFGESRILTYAWFIHGAPYRHWRGDPAAGQALRHPTRQIAERPTVYEFATPVGGTYPVWFDPSYWYDGTEPRFNLQGQIRAVAAGAHEYHSLFLSYVQSSLVFGFLILVLMSTGWRNAVRQILARWALLLPALAGLGLFLLMFVLPRYVAPFVVLLWLALFSSVRLPNAAVARRAIDATVTGVALMLTFLLLMVAGPVAYAGAREAMKGEAAASRIEWQVVDALRPLNLQPGDRVAAVHPSATSWGGMVGWAWLADLQIVAEIPPESSLEFWQGDDDVKERTLRALAGTGARVAVAMRPEPGWLWAGWTRLGSTDYYAYDLRRLHASVTAAAGSPDPSDETGR
jgi:hypothetical protein